MTVCCNNGGVVSSDRLFRSASRLHVNRKQKKKMLAGPEAKESPGFFDLVAFLRSPTIVGALVQFHP